MGGIGEVVGKVSVVIAVITAISYAGHMLDVVTVFNQGITVAASGGNITPYIEALMLIMVAAVIPGWLKALT